EEVPVLASPWRRLQQRLQALNRAGFRAYFKVSRLQTAQLDLAMERWHRERKEIDTPLEADQQLRNRVIQIRHWVTAQQAGFPAELLSDSLARRRAGLGRGTAREEVGPAQRAGQGGRRPASNRARGSRNHAA